jgi:hypothetical protein
MRNSKKDTAEQEAHSNKIAVQEQPGREVSVRSLHLHIAQHP